MNARDMRQHAGDGVEPTETIGDLLLHGRVGAPHIEPACPQRVGELGSLELQVRAFEGRGEAPWGKSA